MALSLAVVMAYSPCGADDCTAIPKSMTMDYTGIPVTNQAITFTVEGVSDCDTPLYYYFSYCPNYGESDYDANTWVNMRDVFWSTDNSITYSFTDAGSYVVVAWVSTEEATPNPIQMVGATVTVTDSGSSGECIFDATALDVTVSDATTGVAISGATITAYDQTATTSSSGMATIAHLPTATEITVTVSADGYTTQTSQVYMECGESQTQGFALLSETEAAEGDIRIILTWGENPRDLDSHLTGPMTSGDDRFHVYYSNTNRSWYNDGETADETIPAWLDVDDTSSYGPETVSIEKKDDGTYVAGTYRYYVHHYSGTENIPTSGAIVKVYNGGTEIRSFSPPTTSEAVASSWVWSVFSLTLTADGTVSITPVNTYSGTHYSSDTEIFRSAAEEAQLPEQYYIFSGMPEK